MGRKVFSSRSIVVLRRLLEPALALPIGLRQAIRRLLAKARTGGCIARQLAVLLLHFRIVTWCSGAPSVLIAFANPR